MDHNTFRLVRFSTVRDVLGLFRDKTVRDVLDPDIYLLTFSPKNLRICSFNMTVLLFLSSY
jgi:hypothetical protein